MPIVLFEVGRRPHSKATLPQKGGGILWVLLGRACVMAEKNVVPVYTTTFVTEERAKKSMGMV